MKVLKNVFLNNVILFLNFFYNQPTNQTKKIIIFFLPFYKRWNNELQDLIVQIL